MSSLFRASALVILSAISLNLGAQRLNVLEEVAANHMKACGLDSPYIFDDPEMTPAPKGYEAFYVDHYGRHGSRYAYGSFVYQMPRNILTRGLEENNLTPAGKNFLDRVLPLCEKVKNRIGDLTDAGWNQQYRIAGIMAGNFPSAFGKGARVRANSSTSMRAAMSMSAFCLGLGQSCPGLEILAHNGREYLHCTHPNDDGNPYKGQRVEAKPLPCTEKVEDFFGSKFDWRGFLGRYFKDVDLAVKGRDVYQEIRSMYMLEGGMNSLDEDVRVDFDDIFTDEEYTIMWEIENYEHMLAWYPATHEISAIVEDMVSTADEHIAANLRGGDFRFGHDHVVMPLMMLLHIDSHGPHPKTAEETKYYFQTFYSCMASNVQMVFYRPKKSARPGRELNAEDVLVKVVMNGHEAKIPVETGNWPYYEWTAVRDFYKSVVAQFSRE